MLHGDSERKRSRRLLPIFSVKAVDVEVNRVLKLNALIKHHWTTTTQRILRIRLSGLTDQGLTQAASPDFIMKSGERTVASGEHRKYVDRRSCSQAPGNHHRDGRVDDAVWPVFVLLDVQGHLSRGQHPRGQPGLVLPRNVGTRNREADH